MEEIEFESVDVEIEDDGSVALYSEGGVEHLDDQIRLNFLELEKIYRAAQRVKVYGKSES